MNTIDIERNREQTLMANAVRKSLGLEDSFQIDENTRLGDLDGNVEYTDLLYIFHNYSRNSSKLKYCFELSGITCKGVKFLKKLANWQGYDSDEYFRDLNLIGENETLRDYEKRKKGIALNFKGFRIKDLIAISDYLERLDGISWIFKKYSK